MKRQMTLRSFLVLTCLLLGLGLHAQALTIHVATPGTLSSYIPSYEKYLITSLTLTGDLNGTDIRYIREMAGWDVSDNATSGKLSILDISGANIVAGGDYYRFLDIYSSDNTIGNYMFYGCPQLTSISIPTSVTSIGDYAFAYCTGLTSIVIPTTVTTIGDCAFYGCRGLTSITIPTSVTSIGDSSFEGCIGFTSVVIPSSVTSMGFCAFSGCIGLTSVTIGSGLTSIGGCAFQGCTGLTSVTIPNGVTSMGAFAFSGCTGLTSVTIPNSVTTIDGLFYYCTGLTSITIPKSVTTIESFSFEGCSGLKDIICQRSTPPKLGSLCFEGIDINTCILWVPKSATMNYFAAKVWHDFPNVFEEGTVVEHDVTSPGAGQLQSTLGVSNLKQVTKLTISGPINGTDILFIRSKLPLLRTLNLENAVIVSGGVPYYKSYTTTDNHIGEYAFSSCSELTSVNIPNSVTSIDNYAFDGCSLLTSVTIPNSVTSIGDGVFYNCSALTSITIPNSVTSLGHQVFFQCIGLTSVTIGTSVTFIGSATFLDCTGLTSMTIPGSVTSIQDDAFSGCSSLTSITIPSSVTSIGYGAFQGCSGLTSITIGSGVTSISESLFTGCSGLKEILVSEENSTFSSVDGVLFSKDKSTLLSYPFSKSHSYVIPHSVTSIGAWAFKGCSELTSVTIPTSITSIGNGAFSGCTGLTSVTIPTSVTSIGNGAFSGCTGLTEIHNNKAIPQWPNSYVFEGIDKTNCTLYVPEGSYSAYRAAIEWGDFVNIIEEDITSNVQIQTDKMKVYTEAESIVIEGAEPGEQILVYTESGAFIQTTKATGDIVRINVPRGHTYLIKTAAQTFKIAL